MVKTKTNNNLYIGIAVVAIVVIAIVVGVMVAKNNGGSTGNGSGDTPATVTSFDTIDETVDYGDYEGMFTLSKSIQNGYSTNKIVKIDGIVSHPMSTYSIVQENADGTEKVGTQFVIDGAEESDYPKDGNRVVITGKVVEKEPLYFIIKTTPEYVEIK